MDERMARAFDLFRFKHRDYAQCFGTLAGQGVLRDLAAYCGAGLTPGVKRRDGSLDRDATLVAIGRQEVWLRIQKYMHLTAEELYLVATGKTLQERIQETADGTD